MLLSDLVKAFKRVNPHWITHVLVCREVSYWVLNCCPHILFERRVLHKIHSTFPPLLAIHNGVDVGRAFSILFFVLLWILGITMFIKSRGFSSTETVDDFAIGDSDLEWLFNAQTLFQKFSEAGFVVLAHQCYTVECVSEPSYQTPCFLSCESMTNSFPSLRSDHHICAFALAHVVSYFIFTSFFFLLCCMPRIPSYTFFPPYCSMQM